jgi:hypothetical protein
MADEVMKPRSRLVRIHVELERLGIEIDKRSLYPPRFGSMIAARKAYIPSEDRTLDPIHS